MNMTSGLYRSIYTCSGLRNDRLVDEGELGMNLTELDESACEQANNWLNDARLNLVLEHFTPMDNLTGTYGRMMVLAIRHLRKRLAQVEQKEGG
jgi:hypothetical protein